MLTLFAALHGVKDPASSASHYIEQLGIEKVSQISGVPRRVTVHISLTL